MLMLPLPWSDVVALLMLATAMSFTPGPNTTLSTALAANAGLRRALRFCLAVPVGWALMLGLCSVGLGAAIAAEPVLRGGIKAIGLGYLLWLAWKLAGSAQLGQADARRLQVGFWQGVALQFVNIKGWMFALSVTAGWVLPGSADGTLAGRLALVLPTMMAYAFASNFTYALVGALLRGWLARGRRLLWFNRGMAAVLVLTAGWMGVAA
jgi:threonine/homoserine/homoserine lactone efflux protein